jgi:hypothetical protein
LLVPVLAGIAAGVLATPALGDADPASDVLYAKAVFYSFDKLPSDAAQKRLNGVVTKATKAGYPVRVALIATPSDLGGVASLWAKPRQYARFLGLELTYLYKGSLLVVMPAGLGYSQHGQTRSAAYMALSGVRVKDGPDGLADTAVRAIARLAAAAGHPIQVPPKTDSGGDHSWRDRLVIVLVGLVLTPLLAAGYLLRRRKTSPG